MRVAALALPIAVVVLVVAIVVAVRRQSLVVGINEHDDVVRIARHTRSWRAGGLLVGLLGGALLAVLGTRVDALGRLTALAPTVVGGAVLLGTVVGELTARPRVGVRRSAAVETRRFADVVPRARAVTLGAASLVLVGILAAGTVWGSPDDLGRPGRAFAQTCSALVDGAYTTTTSSQGPWPGSFYTGPLAGALVVLVVLTVLALRAVVARPRPDLGSRGLDTTLRRWSAGNVLTAGLFTVLATTGPLAVFVGWGLVGADCPLSGLQGVVGPAAAVLGPLAVIGAAGCLGALLVGPTVRVDDLPRPLPGDAAPVGAPVR